jgi:hypothetical protein
MFLLLLILWIEKNPQTKFHLLSLLHIEIIFLYNYQI